MKKIMFNDACELTQAVLVRRKRMTRRIIAGFPSDAIPYGGITGGNYYELGHNSDCFRSTYRLGEEVAVAQRYEDVYEDILNKNLSLEHARPILEQSESEGWGNKMFVKAELMPHRIRITNIKVERLQDISDTDCLLEGITTITEGKQEIGNAYGWDIKCDWHKRDSFFTPKDAFAALIDKVSGRGTWIKNPWVFAYKFELIK